MNSNNNSISFTIDTENINEQLLCMSAIALGFVDALKYVIDHKASSGDNEFNIDYIDDDTIVFRSEKTFGYNITISYKELEALYKNVTENSDAINVQFMNEEEVIICTKSFVKQLLNK